MKLNATNCRKRLRKKLRVVATGHIFNKFSYNDIVLAITTIQSLTMNRMAEFVENYED
jgi:hypothetical protein